jgi:hypothetical protein
VQITTAGMKHRAKMEWRSVPQRENRGHTRYLVLMWWESETYHQTVRLFDGESPTLELRRAVNEILKEFGVRQAEKKTQAKLKAARP